MGAEQFFTYASGKDAREAFSRAVQEARYEHGHGGYTGTIAEKHSFTIIECPKGISAGDYAQQLLDDCDSRVDDKWGPAGCIEILPSRSPRNRTFLFFGWASS